MSYTSRYCCADARPDVGTTQRMRMESPDVALAKVCGRLAVHDPLGDRLSDTSRVSDPDRLRRPESLDLGRLTQYGKTVGGEREYTVELASQPHALQAGKQLAGRGHRCFKVRRRERHLGGRNGSIFVVGNVVGVHQERFMSV